MRTVFAFAVARAYRWVTVTLTDSYLRAPHPLKKYLERRNLHAPHENVSAMLWLSGAQAWCLDWLEDELSITAGLLFVACGVVGTWLGRRLFA
jgi:hypothetical protein